jgi:uncharacterized protein (TIGR00252 family)
MAFSKGSKRQEDVRKTGEKRTQDHEKEEEANRYGKRRIKFGREGESVAIDYLEKLGWTIVEHNWRAGRYGELDIVCEEQDGVLVFVEVKTRRSRDDGANQSHVGFEAVGGLKQNKIVSAALRYLARNDLTLSDVACRFDVIVVHHSTDAGAAEPEVLHVRDAFHRMGWS